MEIQIGQTLKTIYIHNVYNLSPILYTSIKTFSIIPALELALANNGEHILFGDFNFHYPYWNSSSRLTQHKAADRLLEVIHQTGLSLTLPRGTITWEARNTCSIIDLIFMTETLVN